LELKNRASYRKRIGRDVGSSADRVLQPIAKVTRHDKRIFTQREHASSPKFARRFRLLSFSLKQLTPPPRRRLGYQIPFQRVLSSLALDDLGLAGRAATPCLPNKALVRVVASIS
jgi:hypothetical protein